MPWSWGNDIKNGVKYQEHHRDSKTPTAAIRTCNASKEGDHWLEGARPEPRGVGEALEGRDVEAVGIPRQLLAVVEGSGAGTTSPDDHHVGSGVQNWVGVPPGPGSMLVKNG